MSYKNKTYIIFDGDKDMWAYGFMKGWKQNDRIDFDFNDAHDLKPLSILASEETVKARLRERFSNTKQVIVLVGESTRYLYKFVRWELDIARELGLPIIVVNLNNNRRLDEERCPPIIRDDFAVHVSFKMKIIRYALDNFPSEYYGRSTGSIGWRYYSDPVYESLGIEL